MTGDPDAAWSPEAAVDARVALDLPGYEDFVPVARGGESVVYRARQVGLGRLVAIKVLSLSRDTAAGDSDSRRWFQRELEITMRLGQAHPNIVTVLDTRRTGAGEPCIVMEYYELGSVHDQLRAHGPMPSTTVVTVGTVIADALAYAHGQAVLHRDVKPQNILALPTSYVLADFGLARDIATERSASLERFSYRHAAPQVLDGELPTAADDIYSLASTLFTLLDGRSPFAAAGTESDSALAYLRRVRTEEPRAITAADAPPELVAIINRCLSRRREDRFPDAASLRDALATITADSRLWAPGSVYSGQTPAVPVETPPTVPPSIPATVPLARSVIEYLDKPTPPHPTVPHPAASNPAASNPAGGPDPDSTDAGGPDPGVSDAGVSDAGGVGIRAADLDRPDEGLEPTGRRPEPVTADPGSPDQPRWPRFAARVGIALLLGGVLGLGGSWLVGHTTVTGGDRPGANPSSSSGRPVPSFTGTLPAAAGPTGANDPTLAPVITTLDDRGDAVELHWIDRSGGTATFVIVSVTDQGGSPVRQVAPGGTSVVIDGLDPAAARYCFQIIAVANTARGISALRCTAPRR